MSIISLLWRFPVAAAEPDVRQLLLPCACPPRLVTVASVVDTAATADGTFTLAFADVSASRYSAR